MSENYSINLKPVYSKTVPTPDDVKLPNNWSLSWHQVATLEALRNPSIEVIFNTAMTGDGKSLAAYLQAMTSRTPTLAMYPTNELARDQEKQVQGYKDIFKPQKDPQIRRLTAAIFDAGNFIQRFGRLGRHKGFEIYQAYALVPNFLVARLFADKSHPLEDGETYDRISFKNTIDKFWTFKNQFERYPQRWGGIQSAYIYSKLQGNHHMKEKYPEVAKKFGISVQNALGISIKQMNAQFYRCQSEGKTKIIDEARSFRGSSQLDCAIYDLTNPDEPETERFKMYNLPGILNNFIFELWDKNSFMEKADKAGVITTRFDKALCYLKFKGYRDVREDWHFYYPGNLRELAKSGKVQVLPDKQHELQGLEISQRHGYGINQISDAVSRRKLVCFISDRDRNFLRATLGLPMHFQAYPITDEPEDRKPHYTIIFGQDALLLETLTWHWKPKDDEGWIC
ncbi:MAG: type I-D CRISPR-associated helicase Cas3' [Nostoc sp. DedSLP03]|uniref:type I-D CRISPR-associated helicase Cas3' n=1 Tax=Nostoc sp. DedSLP03 TaxID=3075400 RepID=UPI002AD22710|nr:type I-D CRISPR-associated helicase Cas3' [Nostoc sp. DedSLP03]MDZ7968721.1 type I-D CRISPR-associated helicase Cas3' [Nostoc sp. DedSLP03]